MNKTEEQTKFAMGGGVYLSAGNNSGGHLIKNGIPRNVLLLCAGHNDLGSIRALKKLGCRIIATGNDEKAPGLVWVDEYIKADYSDKELILSIAESEKIDGICACCNDFGVYTAAYVAEKLGLRGYDDYATTLTLHNKDKFKLFAKEHGIQTPLSVRFTDPAEALIRIAEMKFPVIVKPTDCSAGNGVSIVRGKNELENAVKYAFGASRSGCIVAEPYITGTQHGFCTFLLDRKVVACCTNDEYSIVNPFRVEIDTFPATGRQEHAPLLISEIEKIADILKLKDGIFHLQYIVDGDGKPWIIEVMRRILGNMYHVPGNMLCGLDWEYWQARALLGLDCSDFPRPIEQIGCYAYKTILARKSGKITHIRDFSAYEKYIFDSYMLLKEGDTVTDYRNRPVGFLFMMFRDREEMHRVLIDEYRNDFVETDGGADGK